MNDRRLILVLLMIGWAMAVMLLYIIREKEQMAACVEHPSAETCCPDGKCQPYKPASVDK